MIIFDFDGTIANSSIVFMHGWNAYADQYRYLKVDESDIELARKLTLHECAKRFHFPMYKMPIILPKIYSYFKQHVHEIEAYEGMKEALEALKKEGYALYILSSNDKANIEAFLQHNDITVIDEVLTSNKLFGKDRVLKRFMRERKVEAESIFYVGDELRDIEACNKCNIDFGWVSWGLQGFELIEKEKPKMQFQQPSDIIKAFQGDF